MNRRKKAALRSLLGFKPKRKRARRRSSTRPRGWSAVEDWVMNGPVKAPAKRATTKRRASTRRRPATGPRGWSAAYDQVNGRKKAPASRLVPRTDNSRGASVTCPWCAVDPGRRCIAPSGRAAETHAARLAAAYGYGKATS